MISNMTWYETEECLDGIQHEIFMIYEEEDPKKNQRLQVRLDWLRMEARMVGDRRFQLVGRTA